MEPQQIEEKLNLEKAIADLRREYKSIFSQLDSAKKEYNAIIGLNKDKEKILEDNKTYLKEVLEDISDAKTKWMLEKDEEMKKLADKISEAENVLKRKKELNEQEQKIRDIQQKDQDILNETRTLEFKLGQDKTALEVEKRQLEEQKKKHSDLTIKEEQKRVNFKDKISSFLKECQEKL